jgi:hypothetical protein
MCCGRSFSQNRFLTRQQLVQAKHIYYNCAREGCLQSFARKDIRCSGSEIHGVMPAQVSLSHSNYRIYTGCSQKANLMKEAHCVAPDTKMLMDVANSYLAGRLHTAARRTISGYMNSCQACNVYKVYNC